LRPPADQLDLAARRAVQDRERSDQPHRGDLHPRPLRRVLGLEHVRNVPQRGDPGHPVRAPMSLAQGGLEKLVSVRGELFDTRRSRPSTGSGRAVLVWNWETGMIRKTMFAALLACAATPALAQNGPPPSPYAP